LSNEITKFISSPRRELTYYSISNSHPATKGWLKHQKDKSSLKKPPIDSIPTSHFAKENTTAYGPDL
jgi:hypothetical protein